MDKAEQEKLLALVRQRFKERKEAGLEPEYYLMRKGKLSGMIHPEHVELRLKEGWKFHNL